MYQKERLDEILKILRDNHYVTVEYLVKTIKYSPATIRRDLTMLEKQGLVARSHGGVEIKAEGATPFVFRQHSMKYSKNKAAEAAAKLIKDNDTVFIDGSTSCQLIYHYLENKKDITVVTNNMMLASHLSECGIKTYCTGGVVLEIPGILSGNVTNDTYARFHADIMFFSTRAMGDGNIYESNEVYFQHHKIMLKNSDKHVYIGMEDKIEKKSRMIVCTLDDIDYVISDAEFDREIVERFKNTKFITVKKSSK